MQQFDSIIAYNEFIAFRKKFCTKSEQYLWLLYHAALPIALTPDLFYKLWFNFRYDEHNNELDVPFEAIADTLHSSICRRIGKELFEIDPGLRTYLLMELQANPRFGKDRIKKVAHFLQQYIENNPTKIPNLVFKKAQEWVAMAYLEPDQLAENIDDILSNVSNNLTSSIVKLNFFLNAVRQRNALDESFSEANQSQPDDLTLKSIYAKGMVKFLLGEDIASFEEFEKVKGFIKLPGIGMEGFKMDMPREVLYKLNILNENINQEENEWQTALSANSIKSYQNYIELYPNGKFVEQASKNILELRSVYQDEKIGLLEDILKYQEEKYPPPKLQQLFNEGKISKEDLYQTGAINAQELAFYFKPPSFLKRHIKGWKGVGKMPKNGTDVYFLGDTYTGKTCLLASLLHYARKNYKTFKFVGENMLGELYAEDLIRAVQLGVIPSVTPKSEGLNYISIETPVPKRPDILNRYNLIEMSGEILLETTKKYKRGNIKSSLLGKFLKNNNQKIMFLLLDYERDIREFEEGKGYNQSIQLIKFLQILEKEYVFPYISALHIVITKSDFFPGGVENDQEKLEFMQDFHSSLIRRVKEKAESFNFHSRLYASSIGKLKLFKQSFEPTDWSSEKIFLDMVRVSIGSAGRTKWKFW